MQIVVLLFSLLLFAENYLTFCATRPVEVTAEGNPNAFFEANKQPQHQQDPECGWLPVPGDFVSCEDSSVIERVWPDGQRASRPDINKRGRFHVLLLGCSYTFGLGVAQEQTFAWRLNEMFPEVVFDNCGVDGYGPQQCSRYLKRRLLEHHYDLVIYAAIRDHVNRNNISYVPCNGELLRHPYANLENGQLVYHCSELVALPVGGHSRSANLVNEAFIKEKCDHPEVFTPEESQANYNAIVADMNNQTRRHGAAFLLATLDGSFADIIQPQTLSHQQIIEAVCNLDNPDYHICGSLEMHPNGAANKIWADKIAVATAKVLGIKRFFNKRSSSH